MNALIVAAGQGTRLRDKGPSKPLIPILGTPLIERVITSARRAGIETFTVVSGYRGETLRAALDEFSARDGVEIRHVINDDWERPNGISVYKAKALFDAPFLLTMCDHLVDPSIICDLLALPIEPDTVTLGGGHQARQSLERSGRRDARQILRWANPTDRQNPERV